MPVKIDSATTKRVEEVFERMKWTKSRLPPPPSVIEAYDGKTSDLWICSVVGFRIRIKKDETIPGFKGAVAMLTENLSLDLTPELAEKACNVARRQLQKE